MEPAGSIYDFPGVRLLRCVCIVLALGQATAGMAKPAEWTQIRLSNFLFISDAPQRKLRATVQKLEQFREVVERVVPRLSTRSPVPTVVVVFADMREMRQYQPRSLGEIKNVSGYFQPGTDINYIAMAADSTAAFEVVFHEYLHFLIDNTDGVTPSWYGEGVSQLYQTLRVDQTSGKVVVGSSPSQYMPLLKRTPLIPLGEVMQVEEPWTAYHDFLSRGLFYAQSWALMHYLVIGNEARAGQVDEYLTRYQSGDTWEQAFAAAFKTSPAALEDELSRYVRRLSIPKREVVLGPKQTEVNVPAAQPIATADVQAYLGDLLARTGQPEEGRRVLTALLEADSRHARAAAALGAIEVRASRFDVGVPLLERAVELEPDNSAILAALGVALYEQARRQWDPIASPATFERSRTLLGRSIALDPNVAPVHLTLGYAEWATGNRDLAVQSIGRAISLAPARKDYRLSRAQVLVQQRDHEQAERELRPLAERATPEIRRAARALLEMMTTDGPAAMPLPVGAPGRSEASGIPALRPLREGERAAIGTFVSVDCSAVLSIYRIQTDRETLQLSAAFGGVQFVVFRSDGPRSIGCGPMEAQRVRVTYRPATADGARAAAASPSTEVHGTAIAIEFIPDGFTPR
jgi:tetratricopeptide (TPR) repeat protein